MTYSLEEENDDDSEDEEKNEYVSSDVVATGLPGLAPSISSSDGNSRNNSVKAPSVVSSSESWDRKRRNSFIKTDSEPNAEVKTDQELQQVQALSHRGQIGCGAAFFFGIRQNCRVVRTSADSNTLYAPDRHLTVPCVVTTMNRD